ncbi:M23 family metallopeptidase [Mucilaginibacter glaciei]|uniref:M23 family metallopeptidase n=1 Tax=Mucilaginibacter glaciei TaxID=2772109 RepID=A0A926NL53_9SPHI|nr:M23 family metallopeptidase [Mucilaginibacter glaciei]MBD1394094.1 M23 family metallopeptidase [Mucilaginibacter glaciei]
MKTLLLLVSVAFIAVTARAQDARLVCLKINDLNTKILNSIISRPEAARQFKALIIQLSEYLPINDDIIWTFPLQGYTASAIGGTNGNGYSDKGYNFLDGNKHAAHPAHDIFIKDKNQDGLDDRTMKAVNVLAVADGIVIACNDKWLPESSLRGGKFIWIYHRSQHSISYYAHNSSILVTPGDIVKAGQKIAEVGRTGLNAYKKRSPTHLHFSAFALAGGLPVPYNPYQQLLKSVKK